MMTINDLTIQDLIKVADDPSLSPEQSKKIKIYTMGRLEELRKSGQLSEEQSTLVNRKVKEIKADVFGVDDMGYPYKKEGEQPVKRCADVKQHVDMYCGSESLA